MKMKNIIVTLILISLVAAGCAQAAVPASRASAKAAGNRAVATFAGGCFWCMQPPFDRLPGVISSTAGYTGGSKNNPTYEEVSEGGTGHAEAVQIVYDPTKVSYAKLLDVFWHNVDPTVSDQQFCDHGNQYRTAIFYHDTAQKAEVEKSILAIEKGKKIGRIFTQVVPASTFYPAEGYHQKYYLKNPVRYKFYRLNCGRDRRLKELWGVAPEH